ncbi:MAG: pilus assembly protein TadG-related protein [Dialister sp.]|nr:pilus assembly protein TadG-related protein [Dialister sp.]
MTFLNRLLSRIKNERGAYMVFFAILIPILFGCAGLAVDLGNGFAHHARLQKAADAAALAGAAAFAMNQETVDSHPKADAQAETYAKVNWGNGRASFQKRPQAQTVDGVSYYRVLLQESIPTTFIKFVGIKEDLFNIEAEAVAVIPTKSNEQLKFDSLASFSGSMSGTFNNNNGTDNGNNNPIASTYDGHVVCYNQDFYNANYNKPEFQKFFTGEARNLPRNEAVQKGLYSPMEKGNESDFTAFCQKTNDAIDKMFSDPADYFTPARGSQNCSLPNSDYDGTQKNKVLLTGEPGNGNFSLTLGNLAGDPNEPVYVYLKGVFSLVNINLQKDIKRPIIFCLPEKNPWWPTEIHFNGNDHDFRGVLYTPYANNTPLNFENGTFRGTILTHDLTLQSNHGSFVFEEFGFPTGGSSSSGGTGSGSSSSQKLRLVDGSKFSWQ